ncbi:hypothetical protein [Devosia aurantiaca]|uniref:hypothetical protein n=1 Tax=Devosia aurantiaca TaxID=2714858 RepID=UPI001F1A7918|nr:hypothetical protein [Devosia aurantiaca]
MSALLLAPAAVPVTLVAQDMSNEEQKGFLTNFVEDRLSTPERQIRLSNIDGVLGSNVSINEITISDAEGVWLRVNNASLNWNQAALFLGRLEVNSLRAESIEYVRNAIPVEGAVDLPPPEAGTFEIPEFPVAIQIGELAVPSVRFGEDVFGLGSEISRRFAGAGRRQSRCRARYRPSRRTRRHARPRRRLQQRNPDFRSWPVTGRAAQWRHRQSPQYRGPPGGAADAGRAGAGLRS